MQEDRQTIHPIVSRSQLSINDLSKIPTTRHMFAIVCASTYRLDESGSRRMHDAANVSLRHSTGHEIKCPGRLASNQRKHADRHSKCKTVYRDLRNIVPENGPCSSACRTELQGTRGRIHDASPCVVRHQRCTHGSSACSGYHTASKCHRLACWTCLIVPLGRRDRQSYRNYHLRLRLAFIPWGNSGPSKR